MSRSNYCHVIRNSHLKVIAKRSSCAYLCRMIKVECSSDSEPRRGSPQLKTPEVESGDARNECCLSRKVQLQPKFLVAQPLRMTMVTYTSLQSHTPKY